jgi:hypothetical protein
MAQHVRCGAHTGDYLQARRELKIVSRAKPSARAPSGAATTLGRLPRQEDADSGERRLHLMMTGTQFFALERLVAHFVLSRRAVIERLIDWADDTFSRSLHDDDDDDDDAFKHYIDRDRNEKQSPH